MNCKKAEARLIAAVFMVLLYLTILLGRLFYIQVLNTQKFKELATRQQTDMVKIDRERGIIYDRNGIVLAMNKRVYSVYANPREIQNKKKSAEQIANILNLNVSTVSERISTKKGFVWLKRKVSPEEKVALEEQKIKGVYFLKEYKRAYPQESVLSQVLGFTNIDNEGLEGIERAYNKYLSSTQGEAVMIRDNRGKNLPFYKELNQGTDGYDLELNIDAHIQYWADFLLEKSVIENKAKAGYVTVMDPNDGRILAISNYPIFDPNNINTANVESLRNRAVSDYYEPGSVFKILTLVAALENIKKPYSKKYDCEMGAWKIPGTILHDWKKFGTLSFEEVFMHSSNIGIAKIVQEIGPKKFAPYLKKFALGEYTGIDLPAESPGYVKQYKNWSKTSPYIIPIGQEVAVTQLQLARMLSAIINGGYLVKPYVLKSVKDKKGVEIKTYKSQIKGPIIDRSVSDKARILLGRVAQEGTGKRATQKNVKIGGKTGTAQKVKNGTYSKSDYYVSFIGFFPLEKPQYVIAVTVDEPKGIFRTGGSVAAPLFGKIAEKIIEYTGLGEENSLKKN